MDGCRPVSRAGRAVEAGKPHVPSPTAHAAQTGRVGQDTEIGTRAHPSWSSGERRARTFRRCSVDGSLLPTSSADVSGCHVSPKVRSPVT